MSSALMGGASATLFTLSVKGYSNACYLTPKRTGSCALHEKVRGHEQPSGFHVKLSNLPLGDMTQRLKSLTNVKCTAGERIIVVT